MFTATIPTSSKEAAARALHPLGEAHIKIFYNAGGGVLLKIKVTVRRHPWGSTGRGFERKTNMSKKKKDVYIQINYDNDVVSLFSIEKD